MPQSLHLLRVTLRVVVALTLVGTFLPRTGLVSTSSATDEGTCGPTPNFACIANTTPDATVYEDYSCTQVAGENDCYTCAAAEGLYCIHFGKSVSGYRAYNGF